MKIKKTIYDLIMMVNYFRIYINEMAIEHDYLNFTGIECMNEEMEKLLEMLDKEATDE